MKRTFQKPFLHKCKSKLDVLVSPDLQRLFASPLSVPASHGTGEPATIEMRDVPLNQELQLFKRRITLPHIHLILLVLLLLPLLFVVIEGINAAMLYNAAHNGVQHLLNIKTTLAGDGNQSTGIFDEQKLEQAQQECLDARNDFQYLHDQLGRDVAVSMASLILPQQIVSIRALSQIGIDISDMGYRLLQTAQKLAPSSRGALLANSTQPLVTQQTLDLAGPTIDYLLPKLSDIENQSHALVLSSLPLSDHQRQELTTLVNIVPQARTDLVIVRGLLKPLGWVLGVGEPRTFLIQTMDRTELRPTGGFTGQYGELKLDGGRIEPFSLHDIALVEYAYNSPTTGEPAPQAYSSWWPFANWGLRDSNVSADFPTSAQMAIHLYEQEVGHSVDGNILFSPFLVTRVLQITGPIRIPEYGEIITAQNLEARLHYYQLDNRGIRKEEIVEKVPDSPDAPAQARKLFTARLARVLMTHIRQAPPDELFGIVLTMIEALQTKDLQIYVTNPQIEALLQRYNVAGSMDRSTTHDGIFIVQANLSASKASQYVHTTFHDTVTLDAQGGALHQLQMYFDYRQRGPVYGIDTYRDYVRVYVPPTAHFINGSGFDTGQAVCGGVLGLCPENGLYPQNELVCAPGGYNAGAAAPMLGDPYLGKYHPLNSTGEPTNMQSDEPQRAMFGGWVVIPKDCSMVVTLSWYVPAPGHAPYTLLFQRQSGTFPELDLTIRATPSACARFATSAMHIQQVMDGKDLWFTFPSRPAGSPAIANCYSQPPL